MPVARMAVFGEDHSNTVAHKYGLHLYVALNRFAPEGIAALI
jgi:hypothetical protein